MRKLFSMLLLTLAAAPAFAVLPPNAVSVPEPEALALIAIGGLALFVSRRKK